MYDKILVAVDHSEASDRALLAARDLALLSKGEVWIAAPARAGDNHQDQRGHDG